MIRLGDIDTRALNDTSRIVAAMMRSLESLHGAARHAGAVADCSRCAGVRARIEAAR